MEFMREFPDDETCLQHVWRERYAPNGDDRTHCQRCDTDRVFKRYETSQKRPCWFCQTCGFRIHPLVGTIFERSSTSLHLWLYAIYLITSTRCGISAKHLERELGVHYKTAWRMFRLIRTQLMAQDDEPPLSGEVEVDETFLKGRMRNAERVQRAKDGVNPKNHHRPGTAIVYGAVERGGRIRATTIPDSRARTLLGQTHEYVLPGSLIFTDEWRPYMRLGKLGYTHRRIRHRSKLYVDGDAHTQTIDGFFWLAEERHPRDPSRRLAEVASGLLERVRVALEPPRIDGADVLRPAGRGREQDGLGLLDGPRDDLAERVHEIPTLRHGDLQALRRGLGFAVLPRRLHGLLHSC
jgi:transposase-like protein